MFVCSAVVNSWLSIQRQVSVDSLFTVSDIFYFRALHSGIFVIDCSMGWGNTADIHGFQNLRGSWTLLPSGPKLRWPMEEVITRIYVSLCSIPGGGEFTTLSPPQEGAHRVKGDHGSFLFVGWC